MKIVVTGANGYIGKQFIRHALQQSHQIIAASRQPLLEVSSWIPFDFNNNSNLTLPELYDVILHLAADTRGKSFEVEMKTAKTLMIAANKVGAKFIFVSSQTARENASTSYGRIKWCIEQEILAKGGIVVRLGQVYGGVEQGLFGTLVRFIRHIPILPAFTPAPMIQPIHIDDCTDGLLRLMTYNNIVSRVYCLAEPKPISFTVFLSAVGQYWVGKRSIFMPVPVLWLQWMTKYCGVKLRQKLGIDRLSSLFELTPMETLQDLNTLGLELRALKVGMRHSQYNRRRLISEGLALLTYILKDKPSLKLISRYVQMIEKLRLGIPLVLSPLWLRYPILLEFSHNEPELAWRIDAALMIAEASRQGAIRFLGDLPPNKPLLALFKIFIAILKAVLFHIMRMVYCKLSIRRNHS
jgi:nucleoside-diphosphate-sugar epimerase